MQAIWQQYKAVVFFLLRFLVAYGVLALCYNLYLQNYMPSGNSDPYTKWVGDACQFVHRLVGGEAYNLEHPTLPLRSFWLDGIYVSRIVEGCNAISVMIIFVAFIIAFYTTFKQTLLFILVGLIFVQITNVARIVLLNYITRYFQAYSAPMHDYIFPAIIYGSIVLLWIVWLQFFVFKKPKV